MHSHPDATVQIRGMARGEGRDRRDSVGQQPPRKAVEILAFLSGLERRARRAGLIESWRAEGQCMESNYSELFGEASRRSAFGILKCPS